MTNPSTLHQALVERLRQSGAIQSDRVEAAFRAVPRHLFLPNEPLAKVYQDEAIITKRLNGRPISSSSQPTVMAVMLEQLALESGHRVLEIGAGTGYNAALMAHLVGETGQIITVDLDEDTIENARQCLARASNVQVICADGWFGYPEAAPYDRIILTVGAWDIAIAWQEQLKPDGRLVLPLTLRDNVQLTVAFEWADDCLESVSMSNCGFMKLRGAFAHPPQERQMTKFKELKQQLTQTALFPLLPFPLHLALKLLNFMTFGHSSLERLRIRVYPQETNYIPSAQETVMAKRWTQLVLDWH